MTAPTPRSAGELAAALDAHVNEVTAAVAGLAEAARFGNLFRVISAACAVRTAVDILIGDLRADAVAGRLEGRFPAPETADALTMAGGGE
ncbi:hypothetical protein [Nocardia paucivorans]|uniref:hypothetical protein n=1 Tax=Nocardia paucivorans TaxID=114259 RepID=UPI00031FECB4|nr:hypothetical protein [Nocardia paucivorans]